MTSQPHDSVPGLGPDKARAAIEVLEDRLVASIDLQLALKHIHWNVVGPNFLSVHEMLDDQVAAVREMTDVIAERIATLGGSPNGNPGAVVAGRAWDDYPLGRELLFVHLKQLDKVYSGFISSHRDAISRLADLDPITESIMVDQTSQLEMFQWFVRSFYERAGEGSGITEPSSATAAADQRSAQSAHESDRPATVTEALAAERAARDVDVDQVGESYRDLAEVGANTKGEGSIS